MNKMIDCYLIIDGRSHIGPPEEHGLPHAVPYFEAFPVMPSPSEKGWLNTSSTNRTIMKNTSLEAVLDAINDNVGNQGTVLLVCHADVDGLYMRVATGAAHATAGNLELLLKIVYSIEIIGRPTSAQNNLDKWLEDKTYADWQKLRHGGLGREGHWPFETLFPADEVGARNTFKDNLENAARSFKLRSWRGLVRLVVKILDVRNKHLDRLELRACWMGLVKFATYTVKGLFGCAELVVPNELNFFLDLPIGHRSRLPSSPRTRGSARRRTPLSSTEQQQMAEAALNGPHTRMFRDYNYVVGRYSFGILIHAPFPNWPAIGVTVNRRGETFDFDGHAYVCNPTHEDGPRYEDRDIVRWFIDEYVAPEYGDQWLARHATGKLAIPLHGFWTEEKNKVFVLPGERSYLKMINRT
jgi:hypothetical protein